jgi:hypothetical protein
LPVKAYQGAQTQIDREKAIGTKRRLHRKKTLKKETKKKEKKKKE